MVQSHANTLRNSYVRVYSDNKNVKSILLNGSRTAHVHDIALELNVFCDKNHIILCPEWIPREENQKSDYLSRCYDSGDWHIGQNIFLWLVHLWGPHPVDRFASHSNTKCKRFNFCWWVPGTEGLDALSQSFSSDVNELVPPPRLVLSCVNKMLSEKAVCTMVISEWRSAPFWLID